MCLLVFAWRTRPDLPLILAGNRDEFHARPAAPAGWWGEHEELLGGRDLEAGGSWLALDRRGRLAVVTNVREPVRDTRGRRSRGELVVDALRFDGPLGRFAEQLRGRRDEYGGYNLLIGDGEELHCLSNRSKDRIGLEPGIYGLSNDRLDTPWPKVVAARDGLLRLVGRAEVEVDGLFELLADRTPAPDDELPDTGVPLEWERVLSAAFIVGSEYGTRASTVVLVRADGVVEFAERRFGPGGERTGRTRLEFEIQRS